MPWFSSGYVEDTKRPHRHFDWAKNNCNNDQEGITIGKILGRVIQKNTPPHDIKYTHRKTFQKVVNLLNLDSKRKWINPRTFQHNTFRPRKHIHEINSTILTNIKGVLLRQTLHTHKIRLYTITCDMAKTQIRQNHRTRPQYIPHSRLACS